MAKKRTLNEIIAASHITEEEGLRLDTYIEKKFKQKIAKHEKALAKAKTPEQVALIKRQLTNTKQDLILSRPMFDLATCPEHLKPFFPKPGVNPMEFNIMCCNSPKDVTTYAVLSRIASVIFTDASQEELLALAILKKKLIDSLVSPTSERNAKIISIMQGNDANDEPLKKYVPYSEVVDAFSTGVVAVKRIEDYEPTSREEIQEKPAKDADLFSDVEDEKVTQQEIDGDLYIRVHNRERKIDHINFTQGTVVVHHGDFLFGYDLFNVTRWIIYKDNNRVSYKNVKFMLQKHKIKEV